MIRHQTSRALFSREHHAGRFQLRIGLVTLVLVVLVSLLPQAHVLGVNPPLDFNVVAPNPSSEAFLLHSNPDSTKLIYLDFTGFNGFYHDYGAWSMDGDDTNYNEAERLVIQKAWQSVAEDYLPFDVDVTTEDPGTAGLKKTGGGDQAYGVRVVIDGSDFYDYSWATEIFQSSDDYETYVYRGDGADLDSPIWIADSVSHEVGHTVNLDHDGGGGDGEYWYGHGTLGTDTYYSPIMGWSNTVAPTGVSQWSEGDYNGANNQQDDLQIISTTNGFGYRVDDHGTDIASPTPINAGVLAEGIIEKTGDLDYFLFTLESAGNVTFDINPNAFGANLDILAKIQDSSGAVLYTSNPVEFLYADFDVILPAGNYFLSIDGTGKGDPATNGYSEYGSLGYYSILGTGLDDPAVLGDINFSGVLDGADWLQFIALHEADLSGLTPEQRIAAGDLNIDGFNNYADLQIFRTYYENAYGLGAFEAMVAAVPEPSSMALLAIATAGLGMWRRSGAG